MKKLTLYEIKEIALKSKRAVFSIQQLANLVKKPKAIAKVYASRLVKKGLAIKLLRGKISFVDDDFVVASQLIEPSYISLSTALVFHNLIKQVPVMVECVTPKNSRNYKKLGFLYHKLPPSLFFGYDKYSKGSSYIFVADSEKAVIDGIYLNLLPKSIIDELQERLNKEKLRKYLSRFNGKGKKKLEKWLL